MSLKSCQKFHTPTTGTMAASSRMDLPLAKAEDIRNNGADSVITCLGRGKKKRKKFLHRSNCNHKREELEYIRERIVQTPRSVMNEGAFRICFTCYYPVLILTG